jgi:hypothetical protein
MANKYDINYQFMTHESKRNYLIARMAEAEQLHFELMVDSLEESHSDYEQWYETIIKVKDEIERLRFLYKQFGGTLGSELPVEQSSVPDGN